MSAPASPTVAPLAVAVVLAASSAEALIAMLALRGAMPVAGLAILHGGVAIFTALAVAGLRQGAGRDPILLLFAISVAFLGPIGVAGCAVTAIVMRCFAWRARPFEEWYAALFPAAAADATRALHERIVLRGHGPAARSTVAPFIDVIALGTVEEKQAAIAMIARRFRPEFARALQAALNDDEAAVRVQAAAAVARIEHHFAQQAMAIDARRAARPDDPALMLEAARHHESFAETGLLDEGRSREAAEAALALHLRLATMHPDAAARADATAACGRLLLRLGRVDYASRLLGAAMRGEASTPEMIGPYLESLFRQRRFVELSSVAARLRRAGGPRLPEPVEEALRLWNDESMPPLLRGAAA